MVYISMTTTRQVGGSGVVVVGSHDYADYCFCDVLIRVRHMSFFLILCHGNISTSADVALPNVK